MKKLETINVNGNAYARVKDRVKAFKTLKNGSIQTECQFKEGFVLFKASIFIEDKLIANGHSLGKSDALKSFEKLETISVGRALAFSGFLTDGGISSSEEMQSFIDKEEARKPELTKDHVKFKTVKEKIKNDDLTPEYFETWFTISDETKKLLINKK